MSPAAAFSWLSTAPFAAILLVKVTALFGVGCGITLLSRNATPAMRHWVWTVVLCGALILPLVMVATPAWHVRILPPSGVREGASVSIMSPSYPHTPAAAQDGGTSGAGTTVMDMIMARASWPLLLWLMGSLVGLGWIVGGRLGLRRLRRRARLLDTEDWRTLLDAERARAGVARPVHLYAGAGVTVPFTCRTRTPVIVLPESAQSWPWEQRLIVLRHELAHVARHDSLAQLLASCACALYWFHPLVWFAARRQRAEGELACDERVLSYGTSATTYAAHLLDVARFAHACGGAYGLASSASVAMARPSQLEGRLLAILHARGGRSGAGVSRGARVRTVGVSLVAVLAVSAFRPIARPPEDNLRGRRPHEAVGSLGDGTRRAGEHARSTHPLPENPERDLLGTVLRREKLTLTPAQERSLAKMIFTLQAYMDSLAVSCPPATAVPRRTDVDVLPYVQQFLQVLSSSGPADSVLLTQLTAVPKSHFIVSYKNREIYDSRVRDVISRSVCSHVSNHPDTSQYAFLIRIYSGQGAVDTSRTSRATPALPPGL